MTTEHLCKQGRVHFNKKFKLNMLSVQNERDAAYIIAMAGVTNVLLCNMSVTILSVSLMVVANVGQ